MLEAWIDVRRDHMGAGLGQTEAEIARARANVDDGLAGELPSDAITASGFCQAARSGDSNRATRAAEIDLLHMGIRCAVTGRRDAPLGKLRHEQCSSLTKSTGRNDSAEHLVFL